ncbi:hypothetical protein [Rhizobium alvei]|uniref:DUF2846 domain-containing protein n=1 Tax=Rhizobium alvei TaxID=1132659 RepID=A0ABT8YKB7_9HYPH|nr:hypothetical protein [Rhizobium alvei]MDO6963700.1 hypothetical protein [Rhizobium alvei]
MKPVLMLLFTALFALSAGCQREDANYISINGKVFIFNIRLARAYYTLTLNRLENVPNGSRVVVHFENPAGGADLVSEQKVFPGMSRIDLQSADLECIVADRPYKIAITLVDPEGKVLQQIDTTLASTANQTVMPAKSLVVGAAYDKNPDAFGKDGKIKFRTACP